MNAIVIPLWVAVVTFLVIPELLALYLGAMMESRKWRANAKASWSIECSGESYKVLTPRANNNETLQFDE